MFTFRRTLVASASLLIVGVVAVTTWFLFGEDLGEETGNRLALEEAQRYAKVNRLDLSSYLQPRIGEQSGYRLYTFTWASKDRPGSRLTVVVDSKLVNVKVIEAPSIRSNPSSQPTAFGGG